MAKTKLNIEKVGLLNTYYAEAPGMITYEDGVSDNFVFEKCTVGIHFTSDEHETLSLSVDNAQLTVPFKYVMQVVEEARKHNLTRN